MRTNSLRRVALAFSLLVLLAALAIALIRSGTGDDTVFRVLPERVALWLTGGKRPWYGEPGKDRPCGPPPLPDRRWLAVEEVFPGERFRKPTQAIALPDGSFLVAEAAGRVLRVAPEARETVLDISDRVRSGHQWGLLGLAPAPGFPADPRIFVTYTAPFEEDGLLSRVAEFSSPDGGRTFAAGSERILLEEAQPQPWHPIAGLRFGPDGYLWVGWGEGGTIKDGPGHARLRGKLLRIDVAQGAPAPGYRIPADNPFPAGPFRPEVWAAGFRNPWRFSFDAASGDVWLGDVGARDFEEIDRVKRGGFYGWPYCEGFACRTPTPGGIEAIPPIAVHPSDSVCSVIGGFLYRGEAIPELRERYIYADFCLHGLYALDPATGETELLQWLDTMPIGSLETDSAGEIYVLESQPEPPDEAAATDRLLRLVRTRAQPGETAAPPAVSLSSLGCLDPEGPWAAPEDFIAYEVNRPAWESGATARRFLKPAFRSWEDGDGRLQGRPMVFLKTLFVEQAPVETRMLSVDWSGAWRAHSFAWEGSDARLVTKPEQRRVGELDWTFQTAPGCMRCHSSAAGHTLAMSPAQLAVDEEGRHQLERWVKAGIVSIHPPGAGIPAVPDAPRGAAAQARAYLDLNCATCHQPGGSAAHLGMDLRGGTALADMGLLRVPPQMILPGEDDLLRIKPGDPDASLLLRRMQADGDLAMPPLRAAADDDAIALVARWIEELPGH